LERGDAALLVRTFDLHLGLVLDAAEVGRRDARVGGRLADVAERQHVAPERRLGLGRQLDGAQPPADRRHRRPDRDTGEVHRAAGQHLDAVGRHGEVRRHPTNYRSVAPHRTILQDCIYTPCSRKGRQSRGSKSINSLPIFKFFAFNALTLLVGRQEEHPACKT